MSLTTDNKRAVIVAPSDTLGPFTQTKPQGALAPDKLTDGARRSLDAFVATQERATSEAQRGSDAVLDKHPEVRRYLVRNEPPRIENGELVVPDRPKDMFDAMDENLDVRTRVAYRHADDITAALTELVRESSTGRATLDEMKRLCVGIEARDAGEASGTYRAFTYDADKGKILINPHNLDGPADTAVYDLVHAAQMAVEDKGDPRSTSDAMHNLLEWVSLAPDNVANHRESDAHKIASTATEELGMIKRFQSAPLQAAPSQSMVPGPNGPVDTAVDAPLPSQLPHPEAVPAD